MHPEEKLLEQIGRGMLCSCNEVSEELYLNIDKAEVVSVHYLHYWLVSQGFESYAHSPLSHARNWQKSLKTIYEMKANPGHFFKIPTIKPIECRNFLLELLKAVERTEIRSQLVDRVQWMERSIKGIDVEAFIKEIDNVHLQALFQLRIDRFIKKKAADWLLTISN
jgi:hypothetical protein